MPLRTEGHDRSIVQNAELAIPLAVVAGTVNGAGFFIFGVHASHMTGQAATLGESLATGRSSVGIFAVVVLTAFVVGATVAAALLDMTSRWRRGRYTPVLLVEVAALVATVLASPLLSPAQAPQLVVLVAFAMGTQNAMVTRISGAVVRTTHITGVITDFGMELWSIVADLARRQRPQVLHQAALHLGLALAFIVGAIAGGVLVQRLHVVAFLPPCLVLCVLLAVDLRTTHA